MPRIPLTPISVDDFTYQPGVTIYLLTHLHTDHLKGLSPSWANGVVIGSEVTIELLKKRMPGLSGDVTRGVEVGTQFKQKLDKAGHEWVEIMVLRAEHCIGSVMYLAKGYFGQILLTGDFRWSASQPFLSNIPELQRDVIDDMYLDDTFLDPNHDFPDWPTATSQIITFLSTLEKADKKPLDKILIKVDLWGKEELLVALSRHFNSLVVVSPERLEMLQVPISSGILPDVWTTSPTEGRIVTLSYKPKDTTIAYMSRQNGGQTVAAVIPSGWVGRDPQVSPGGRVARIGYSAHSSYSEILDFVDWLRPGCIVGISRHDSNVAIRQHLKHLIRGYPAPPITVVDRLEKGRLVPKSIASTFSRTPTTPAGQQRHVLSKTPVRRRGIHLKEAVPTQEDEAPAVVAATPPRPTVLSSERKSTTPVVPTPGTAKTTESSCCLFNETSEEEEEDGLSEGEGGGSGCITDPDLAAAFDVLQNFSMNQPYQRRQQQQQQQQQPPSVVRRLVSIDTPSSTPDSLLADLMESDGSPKKQRSWRPPTPPKKRRKTPLGGPTPLQTKKTVV